MPNRRTLLLAPLAAPLLAMPGLAHAQAYPNRPIRIVIPVVPGGAVDACVRTISPKLSELLGQPVVLDNRPGGAGVLASEIVARAPADGHTLLLGTVGVLSVNPSLFRTLPADPVRDFAPISLLVNVTNFLAVPTDRPWKSVAELVAAMKARPGALSYGSAGIGSAGHLSGALLDHLAKTEAVHVPYRGGGQLITDLISGKIDYSFATAATVLPHIESGRLRVLAVPTEQRSRLQPTVPTMAEAGVPGYAINNWYGLAGPRGTPAPVIAQLNAAVHAALADPGNVEKLAHHALEPAPSTPEEFGAFIPAEITRYAAIIRGAGITGD
jgi:tripartite-type tricarboxylate transporter receptor subunit TctC